MKKTVQFSYHFILWVSFTALVLISSKLYLQAKPDAPFGEHLFYIVFLELFMGLIFFYVPFFCLPWARRKKVNMAILSVILLLLLTFFAYPAIHIGIWEILSSVVPHLVLVFMAIIFRNNQVMLRLISEKQIIAD